MQEISNGLGKDLEDIAINRHGHRNGVMACKFWRKIARGEPVSTDTLEQHYFGLTRDYFSIQNGSGYESLKSRGLEIISDDSLRFEIISLNEYNFSIIRKFEEEYAEMQFHQSFYKDFNRLVASNLVFSPAGIPIGLEQPLELSDEERKYFLAILYRIEINRRKMIEYYTLLESNVKGVKNRIDIILEEN